jgi:hypothetical protein
MIWFTNKAMPELVCDFKTGKLCCEWMRQRWRDLPLMFESCPLCGAKIIWPEEMKPPEMKEFKPDGQN